MHPSTDLRDLTLQLVQPSATGMWPSWSATPPAIRGPPSSAPIPTSGGPTGRAAPAWPVNASRGDAHPG